MCDYSLMNVPNRLAREGEELATYRFGSGSLGLVSQLDLLSDSPPPTSSHRTFWSMLKDFFDPPMAKAMPAVCVPPGARLALMDIPKRLQKVTNRTSDRHGRRGDVHSVDRGRKRLS